MAFHSGQSAAHVNLIQQLINELTVEDFKKLKDHCRGRDYGSFGAGELEKIPTLSDLFSKLQQKRIFKEGSYSKLKELLDKIGNLAAIEKVQEAEFKLINAGIPVVGAMAYPSAMPHPEYQFRYPSAAERMHHYNTPQSAMRPDQFRYGTPPPYERKHGDVGDAMPSTVYSSNGSGHYQSNVFQSPPANQGIHATTGGYAQNFNTNQNQMHDYYYQGGQGYILFINNYFKTQQTVEGENYDFRYGADKDLATIQELHRRFLSQHKLQKEEEVTKNKFWGILADVRDELRRSQYSFFMLILSSHGAQIMQQEWIILPDSSRVTVDEIQEYFNGTNVDALVGKPKMFIIQACRGLKDGIGVPDLADCSGRQTMTPQQQRALTRPDNADVLIAYATSEGTKSWRNEQEGTWYIRHLCEAIVQNSTRNPKEHFLDLLLGVHHDVAKRESNSDERAKQMPCYMTTFTKKFLL